MYFKMAAINILQELTWPESLEARLVLTSVNYRYHRNVQVSIFLNQWFTKPCFEQPAPASYFYHHFCRVRGEGKRSGINFYFVRICFCCFVVWLLSLVEITVHSPQEDSPPAGSLSLRFRIQHRQLSVGGQLTGTQTSSRRVD